MRYINKNTDKNVLNESVILLLHQMLISNIDDTIAGRFRQDGEKHNGLILFQARFFQSLLNLKLNSQSHLSYKYVLIFPHY
jgi:hypothetical protein